MIRSKNQLKDIARRFCKGVIEASKPERAFKGSELTNEELSFLLDHIYVVTNCISVRSSDTNTKNLVKEYLEKVNE